MYLYILNKKVMKICNSTRSDVRILNNLVCLKLLPPLIIIYEKRITAASVKSKKCLMFHKHTNL